MKNRIIIFASIILFTGILYELAWFSTAAQTTITVTDKERIVENDGEKVSSKYIVYTDKGAYENTDILFLGKFNSSDLQGQLITGKTYEVTVYGWRIPFLSMYKNITNVKPIQ
jgi:hypothetical protein